MHETRTCYKCHKSKSITEFHKGQRKCKSCSSKICAEHYRANKARYAERQRAQRQIRAEAVWAYLDNHPCVDCGETDPVVLDFDHREDKKWLISTMIRHKHKVEAIMEEIGKCDVRCSNCHRRKTAKEQGWYKLL